MSKKSTIYAEVIEQTALTQYKSAMELNCVVQGTLMPDVHTGYTLPIGAVIATKDVIFPSWVGYDQGCGVAAFSTGLDFSAIEKHSQEILEAIYSCIPVGFACNDIRTPEMEFIERSLFQDACLELDLIPKSEMAKIIYGIKGKSQLGTLGSGNHFIEIGRDENDTVWIICHSGSRNVGHSLATHYMKLASESDKAKEGHYGLNINSPEGQNYLIDLNFCQEYARINRKRIISRVIDSICVCLLSNEIPVQALVGKFCQYIDCNHNHAELKDGLIIHRKGATHAEKGLLGVIPGNMRDGCFIVKGKGNADSLCSSSHGAGRRMSRGAASRNILLDDFQSAMQGITAKISKTTIDESPFAYKDIFEVMELQKDLLEVLHHVKPIINIKG